MRFFVGEDSIKKNYEINDYALRFNTTIQSQIVVSTIFKVIFIKVNKLTYIMICN